MAKITAICLQCGTVRQNPETGFCVNGHDDWVEERDSVERFSELSRKLNYSIGYIESLFKSDRIRVKDVGDYSFHWRYPAFINKRSDPVSPPENPLYCPGDVVYIKPTNSIGVVLGCIDHESEDLRTDQEGMKCFSDLEPATEFHFTLDGVCVADVLIKELFVDALKPILKG